MVSEEKLFEHVDGRQTDELTDAGVIGILLAQPEPSVDRNRKDLEKKNM